MDFLDRITEEPPLMSLAEIGKTAGEPTPLPLDTKSEDNNLLPIGDLNTADTEQKQDKPDPNKDSKTDTKDTGKWVALGKALLESRGVELEEDETLEDTPEAVLELLDNVYSKDVEESTKEYIEQHLTPLQQKFISLVEMGVSEDEAATLVKSYKDYQAIDKTKLTEDEDLASRLYTQYLRMTTAFSADEIKEAVEVEKTLGTLTKKAEAAYPKLGSIIQNKEKSFEQEQAQRQAREESQRRTERTNLEKFLKETKNIAGLKLTPAIKSKWEKEFTSVKAEDGSMLHPIAVTRQKNPTQFDALIRLYHTLDLFKYDDTKKEFVPDFSKLSELGKAEAVKQLKAAVEADKKQSVTGTADDVTFTQEKEDYIKRFKEIADKFKKVNTNNNY